MDAIVELVARIGANRQAIAEAEAEGKPRPKWRQKLEELEREYAEAYDGPIFDKRILLQDKRRELALHRRLLAHDAGWGAVVASLERRITQLARETMTAALTPVCLEPETAIADMEAEPPLIMPVLADVEREYVPF